MAVTQGGVDVSVSPQKAHEMVLALRRSGKQNIEYLFYEKLDHGLNNSAGQNKTKKVVVDMNAWLRGALSGLNKSMQSTSKASID